MVLRYYNIQAKKKIKSLNLNAQYICTLNYICIHTYIQNTVQKNHLKNVKVVN